MNKQELLKDYKKQEDKICLAQVLDKIQFAQDRDRIEYTDFLDMYQVALVEGFMKKIKFEDYILYGGYEESERKVFIAYSEKYNKDMLEKNFNKILNFIKIQLSDDQEIKFTHRNYLGAVVKLGIKREKVGDIIVGENGAEMITMANFAETLKSQLLTLTRFEESIMNIELISALEKMEVKVESINIIVPSLRIDNIVSDLAKTSRSKAVQIINQERVFINGQNETKVSKQVKLNDIITIRGKGRFVIKEFAGTTRSGRTVLTIEKYV